jgi:hypothetical protein
MELYLHSSISFMACTGSTFTFIFICNSGRSKTCGYAVFCSTHVFVCGGNVLSPSNTVLFTFAGTSMWMKYRWFMLTDLVIWNHLPSCKYCSFTDCFFPIRPLFFQEMSFSLKRCKKKWSNTIFFCLKCPCIISVLVSICYLKGSQNL